MESGKTRYLYLDILKLIAIVLVCGYHFNVGWAGNIEYSASISLYSVFNRFLFGLASICIPLFFMVNGALLLNSNFNLKKHYKKIVVILLQFYFWRIVTIVLLSVSGGISLMDIPWHSLFNAAFLFGEIQGVNLAHMWFIPALLCVYIIVPFIKRDYDISEHYSAQPYTKLFVAVLFIICFFLKDVNTLLKAIPFTNGLEITMFIDNLNPFIGLIGPMLVYFVIGGYLHKHFERVASARLYKMVICFLCGALLLLLKWFLESRAASVTWDCVYNGYASMPVMLMSVSAFVIAAKVKNEWIEKFKVLEKSVITLGENTLNVYYLHWIVGFTLLSFLSENFTLPQGVLLNSLKSITLVIFLSVIGYLMKKIPIIKKLFH